jgi:hypothetical protein
MFQVYDDIIPIEFQNNIKEALFSNQFPWYYLADTTYADTPSSRARPCFTHWYYTKNQPSSPASGIVSDLTNIITSHINFGSYSIVQARSFMQLYLNLSEKELHTTDPLHIDLDFPHTVFIYYVTDSTGDTVLSKHHKYDFDAHPKPEECEIMERITPKQGRVLVFDGSIWHTAFQPNTQQSRCIINVDLESRDHDSTN